MKNTTRKFRGIQILEILAIEIDKLIAKGEFLSRADYVNSLIRADITARNHKKSTSKK